MSSKLGDWGAGGQTSIAAWPHDLDDGDGEGDDEDV